MCFLRLHAFVAARVVVAAVGVVGAAGDAVAPSGNASRFCPCSLSPATTVELYEHRSALTSRVVVANQTTVRLPPSPPPPVRPPICIPTTASTSKRRRRSVACHAEPPPPLRTAAAVHPLPPCVPRQEQDQAGKDKKQGRRRGRRGRDCVESGDDSLRHTASGMWMCYVL